MADIVNLRAARKARARDEKESLAATNRAVHGRTRREREAQAAAARDAALKLDGHRLETGRIDE